MNIEALLTGIVVSLIGVKAPIKIGFITLSVGAFLILIGVFS